MPFLAKHQTNYYEITIRKADFYKGIRLLSIINRYLDHNIRVPNRVLKAYLSLFQSKEHIAETDVLKLKDCLVSKVKENIGKAISGFEFEVRFKKTFLSQFDEIEKAQIELKDEVSFSFDGLLEYVAVMVLREYNKDALRDKRKDFKIVFDAISYYINQAEDKDVAKNYSIYKKVVLTASFLLSLGYVLVKDNEVPNSHELYQSVKHLAK